jgi:hypothetical protein
MANITNDDIQDVYGDQAPSFDSSQQTALKDIAERLTENVFNKRLATSGQIETDNNDFAAYLGAHLWEISEGGEPSSQSQSGGSVNFNHLQTNVEQTLSETRYGRVCLLMIDDGASTSVVRADF